MSQHEFVEREKERKSSLLVEALAVPSLNGSSNTVLGIMQEIQQYPHSPLCKSTGSLGSDEVLNAGIPLHSDMTVPTRNFRLDLPEASPPVDTSDRRNILGGRVKEKYVKYGSPNQAAANSKKNKDSTHSRPSNETQPRSQTEGESSSSNEDEMMKNLPQQLNISNLKTPPCSPIPASNPNRQGYVSPITPYDSRRGHSLSTNKYILKAHETVHAQSLLLGLAFMAIWSPQNLMAPNLTEMATQFGFSEVERDVYLGANVAFATGVLSLPISAGIGILADLYNRKYLFVATVVVGALASFATGASVTYSQLFFARLINGGCMSGSVPVAFSLLGDLFATEERNAASSGLTAMMGMGIIGGQVYAGVVGSAQGWSHAFYSSTLFSLVAAVPVLFLVKEPVRGGKEEVLQDLLRHGTRYDRTLTWNGFVHAMKTCESNMILMVSGFFTSVPWGIIFVFLNDYLSQERGFSIPDATYLVFVFGVGCAVGGILGGYWGQVIQDWNRSYLPLFMSVTTFCGMIPFLLLLNATFTNKLGYKACFNAFMGGCIASLPSVNVRPCLINVNPPESRGAALTAANLIINLARGAGPSCITLMTAFFGVSRQFGFNVTLIFFWSVAAIQYLYLAKSLPIDQDAMETELAEYAASAIKKAGIQMKEDDSIVSIEDRMTSFNAGAARESIQFMGQAFREIGDEVRHITTLNLLCDDRIEEEGDNSDYEDENMRLQDIVRRREIWRWQQQKQRTKDDRNDLDQPSLDHTSPFETTPLL